MVTRVLKWTLARIWSLISRLVFGRRIATVHRVRSHHLLDRVPIFGSASNRLVAGARSWLSFLSLSPPTARQTDINLAADAALEALERLEGLRADLELLQAQGARAPHTSIAGLLPVAKSGCFPV